MHRDEQTRGDIATFDNCEVNLQTLQVTQDGELVPVRNKPASVLSALLKREGQVVPYPILSEEVWPEHKGRPRERNLQQAVHELRTALGWAEGYPIRTIPTVGYQFIGDVIWSAAKQPELEERIEPVLRSATTAAAVVAITDSIPVSPRRANLRKLVWWTLAASLITAFPIVAFMLRPPPLGDFRVQGRNVIGLDLKGRELWRYSFPWPLAESGYVEPLRSQRYWLGNLNGDGEQQLVFVPLPYDMGVSLSVACFRGNGRVRWQFTPGRAVVDGSGDHMVPPYWPNNLPVIRDTTPTATRIVVSSHHYLNQPNQVAFLNIDGKVVGEYWHPGQLLHQAVVDLEGNGKKVLLLGGVNNADHQATLVILDPLSISGAVTPYNLRDHRLALLGMPEAHERAVILFPRSCISTGQPYTRVSVLRVSKDRIVVNVTEGTQEESSLGYVYELDYQLNVVSVVAMSVLDMKTHQEMEAQGKVDHPYDEVKECEQLRKTVAVRRGDALTTRL